MEWIDALRGSTVGLDTGPLIYYIEEHPAFLARIKPFFEAAERNEFRIVTSFVTLIEVLVHPLREGQPELSSGLAGLRGGEHGKFAQAAGRWKCRGGNRRG